MKDLKFNPLVVRLVGFSWLVGGLALWLGKTIGYLIACKVLLIILDVWKLELTKLGWLAYFLCLNFYILLYLNCIHMRTYMCSWINYVCLFGNTVLDFYIQSLYINITWIRTTTTRTTTMMTIFLYLCLSTYTTDIMYRVNTGGLY